MPQLKSASQTPKADALTDFIGVVAFILCSLCFVLIGGGWLRDEFRRGGWEWWAGLSCFLGIGLLLVYGGISWARQTLRFGPVHASMAQTWVRPGESFQFSYQRPCRQRVAVTGVQVFLVFRERVDYYNVSETTTKDVDRLVQTLTLPARVYDAGEVIEAQGMLAIPGRAMGIRNSFQGHKNAKVETMWVLKVRVNDGWGYDVWDEYEVTRNVVPVSLGEPEPMDESFVDVFLTGSRFMAFHRIMKVMEVWMPHLQPGQIGDSYFGRPSLLLERVTREEAAEAKAQLETAGAIIEVRSGASDGCFEG